MSEVTKSSLFAIASLLPAGLIIMAALAGGILPLAAFLSITIWVVLMDRFGPLFDASSKRLKGLPTTVGLLHFAALGMTLWAVGHSQTLTPSDKTVLVMTMGLFAGQVSNACAHELIHRPDRGARRLGTAIYCSILNGHHVSAHLLVHHVFAGTDRDPNSAPLGRGFYRFFLDATRAEYVVGLKAETERNGHRGVLAHPYLMYTSGALTSVFSAWLIGGGWAIIALVALSIHAQAQLLLSDYVQHYGLRRCKDGMGRTEPMGPQHSWNAPHSYSSALMLNASRHSDHHMHPARHFTDLRLDRQMPTLPRSMTVMAAIALIPPLWRKTMDHRAAEWSGHALPPRSSHHLQTQDTVLSE